MSKREREREKRERERERKRTINNLVDSGTCTQKIASQTKDADTEPRRKRSTIRYGYKIRKVLFANHTEREGLHIPFVYQ